MVLPRWELDDSAGLYPCKRFCSGVADTSKLLSQFRSGVGAIGAAACGAVFGFSVYQRPSGDKPRDELWHIA